MKRSCIVFRLIDLLGSLHLYMREKKHFSVVFSCLFWRYVLFMDCCEYWAYGQMARVSRTTTSQLPSKLIVRCSA